MYHDSTRSPQQQPLSPPGFGPDVDLQATAAWLGAPVAVLKTRGMGAPRVAGCFSDSAAGFPSGTTPQPEPLKPVYVTLRYTPDGNRPVDVSTRRVHGDDDLLAHIWATVVKYQLDATAAVGIQWVGAPPPPEIQERLSRPPAVTGTQPVRVDEKSAIWDRITDRDLGACAEIAACGGRIGDCLIAVVGPSLTVADLDIKLIAGTG